MPNEAAVYAVTAKGARLARTIAGALAADLYLPARLAASAPGAVPFDNLPALLAATFRRYRAHVFVAACGIAVRVIAPHLESKSTDPAVVTLDDAGRFAVSLLSGHLGGANDLAREVAAVTGATAVITTATDAAGAPAVEMLARQLSLAVDNPAAVKYVNAALAEGRRLAVFDPLGRFIPPDETSIRFFEWVAAPDQLPADEPAVAVDWRVGPDLPMRLYLRPKVLAVGVGCRRGTPATAILDHIRRVFAEAGLALASCLVLASVDAKRDEAGLIEAASVLSAELKFYGTGELGTVAVPSPSALVARHMGVGSVCEAAAILASGGGRLLVPKTKTSVCTAAVALAT